MFATKVTEQASDILENYFNILSQTGYYNYNSVYKILVFLFIDDLLNTVRFLIRVQNFLILV